jgi:hypothetical protein
VYLIGGDEVICLCGLIRAALMANDVERLLMHLLAVCLSSLEKCLVRPFVYF